MRSKPNILIFMTDQQRGDVLTDENIHLPNIRKLMREGIHFKNTYAPAPHCCPSRVTFFTGLYPTEHGVWNNVCVQNALSDRLNEGVELFSQALVRDGYRCLFSGKWHVSYETGPADHGFEELIVTADKKLKQDSDSKAMSFGWEEYRTVATTEKRERRAGEILRAGYPDYQHYGFDEDPFSDRQVVSSAIQALQQLPDHSEQPWCLYIGTLGPHDPYFVPRRYYEMYRDQEIELSDIHDDQMRDKPTLYRITQARFNQLGVEEKKEAIRHYRAFCTYEDALLGEVLEALDDRDDADETVVLFLSDHGDYMGEHGLWCKGLPCFSGAYHIPAVMRWPAGIVQPGRQVSELISLADFAPTLMRLAGAEYSSISSLTGKDLSPYINHHTPKKWRKYLFTQTNGNEIYGIQRAVFNLNWKLVHNTFDIDEFYDLEKDPRELHNLIDDPSYHHVRRHLWQQLWHFAYTHHDQYCNPYIMVGLAEYGPAFAFTDTITG